jgi:hypothetical protein
MMDADQAEKVLRRIEEATKVRYLCAREGRDLVDLVERFKPKKVLEVSTFVRVFGDTNRRRVRGRLGDLDHRDRR